MKDIAFIYLFVKISDLIILKLIHHSSIDAEHIKFSQSSAF